ncbi:MAG: type II secretion system F family protein [Acidimicrobiales bacterium]
MSAIAVAMLGAMGVFLLYTRFAFGWRSLLPGSVANGMKQRNRGEWLRQAGLKDVRWREFLIVSGALMIAAALVTSAIFGGVLPPLVGALFAGFAPFAAYRSKRARRLALAQDAWPRMIEEIRVLVSNTGRSVPQAVFAVGRRAPVELATAFDDAHREWLLSTDFARSITVLKADLAHPTSDIACETLLTAHDVGGVDLDRRLRDLAEDRLSDVQARKDARAKQGGARFARGFVLLVPVGMALVGLSIGSGRAAYGSASAQFLVATGLFVMVGCYLWAGRIMSIPQERRVFSR